MRFKNPLSYKKKDIEEIYSLAYSNIEDEFYNFANKKLKYNIKYNNSDMFESKRDYIYTMTSLDKEFEKENPNYEMNDMVEFYSISPAFENLFPTSFSWFRFLKTFKKSYFDKKNLPKLIEVFERRCLTATNKVHDKQFPSLYLRFEDFIKRTFNEALLPFESITIRQVVETFPLKENYDSLEEEERANYAHYLVNEDKTFIKEIYSYCVETMVREIYAQQLYYREDINAENFLAVLPNKLEYKKYIVLFYHLVTLALNEFQIEVLSKATEFQLTENELLNKLKRDCEENENKADDMEKKITALNEELSEYKADNKKKIDEYSEQLKRRDEEIKELKEKYELALSKQAKQIRLLEYSDEQTEKELADLLQIIENNKSLYEEIELEREIELEESQKEPIKDFSKKNIDFNAKYLFSLDNSNAYIENEILKIFPNATFVNLSKGYTLHSQRKVDLVVIMTKYIRHATYYKIKEFCKQNDVPYVHCGTTNINTIIQCISDCFDNKIIEKEE